jgi:hypothetical protein
MSRRVDPRAPAPTRATNKAKLANLRMLWEPGSHTHDINAQSPLCKVDDVCKHASSVERFVPVVWVSCDGPPVNADFIMGARDVGLTRWLLHDLAKRRPQQAVVTGLVVGADVVLTLPPPDLAGVPMNSQLLGVSLDVTISFNNWVEDVITITWGSIPANVPDAPVLFDDSQDGIEVPVRRFYQYTQGRQKIRVVMLGMQRYPSGIQGTLEGGMTTPLVVPLAWPSAQGQAQPIIVTVSGLPTGPGQSRVTMQGICSNTYAAAEALALTES